MKQQLLLPVCGSKAQRLLENKYGVVQRDVTWGDFPCSRAL